MDECAVKDCHGSPDVACPTICEPVLLCARHAPWLRVKARLPEQRRPSSAERSLAVRPRQ